MLTSADRTDTVRASNVRFIEKTLIVFLSDGREISMPIDRMKWLKWLAEATPEQRENWRIEPGGYAVYWEDLDDGIEVRHMLDVQPLS